MTDLIYLDNGATSFPKPEEVYVSMDRFYRSYGVNPGRSGFDLCLEAGSLVDETVRSIKDACSLPVILFPATASGVSPRADYIFWMMLMNSSNRRFLVGEQAKAAVPLSKTKILPISMGYIVVSTSSRPTAVERVGEVERISEDDVDKAVSYALTAQYFGMECVYLEAGSGAEKPVSDAMVRAVRKALSVPIIVGGGIRDAGTARTKVAAGADIIVTGTVVERNPEIVRDIIRAVKEKNPR